MKKIMILFVVALAATLTSCSVTRMSALQGNVTTSLSAAVLSDIEVSNTKISYTYTPTRSVRNGGRQNCINAAIAEALAQNGRSDVLVETQEAVVEKGPMHRIKKVTVTGFPAKYKNFKSADEETLKQWLINGKLIRDNVIKKMK